MADLTIPRLTAFEFALTDIRRGLTGAARSATAASVRFETGAGAAAGGPYAAVRDAGVGGWVSQCPARTEATGTVLVSVEQITVGGVVYESRGTVRVT